MVHFNLYYRLQSLEFNEYEWTVKICIGHFGCFHFDYNINYFFIW